MVEDKLIHWGKKNIPGITDSQHIKRICVDFSFFLNIFGQPVSGFQPRKNWTFIWRDSAKENHAVLVEIPHLQEEPRLTHPSLSIDPGCWLQTQHSYTIWLENSYSAFRVVKTPCPASSLTVMGKPRRVILYDQIFQVTMGKSEFGKLHILCRKKTTR